MFPARSPAWMRRVCQGSGSWRGSEGWPVRSMAGAGRAVHNLVFPPCCLFCRCELEPRAGEPLLCQACLNRFWQRRSACLRCASPLPRDWNDPWSCPQCRRRRYAFERAEALGNYGAELQQAVLWMKRLAFEPLTQAVGGVLGRHLAVQLDIWAPDWVIPLPMHFARRIVRGVQPSAVLAEQVAKGLRLPLREKVLYCSRKSLKQGTLSVNERFTNRRGAFSVSTGYDINDKRILLIDDIMTTGATASEAARVLRRAGAAAVAIGVVARGVGLR